MEMADITSLDGTASPLAPACGTVFPHLRPPGPTTDRVGCIRSGCRNGTTPRRTPWVWKEKAEEAKDKLTELAGEAKDKAKEAAHAAQDKADEAKEAVQDKAEEAKDKATELADEAKDKLGK